MKANQPTSDPQAVLLAALKPATGQPLLVSRAAAASRLAIEQFDGGRDAQYFQLTLRSGLGAPAHGAADSACETIGYLPQVAGTTIVYDVTGQTLQGKARPFSCQVTAARPQIYALLPVQIEAISLAVDRSPAGMTVRVEFHDTQGERLRAMLPFHLSVEGSGDSGHRSGIGSNFVTAADGRYAAPLKLPADQAAAGRIVVRSQLTGQETSLELPART